MKKFPLKEFEVWMEGYAATGEHGTAQLIGKTMARSFTEACHILACTQYLEHIKKVHGPNYNEYDNPERWDYDTDRKSYWGCRFFETEAEARKSFG